MLCMKNIAKADKPKSAMAILPPRPFRGSGKAAQTAFKPARRDGNSLILRFYEWAGEETHAKITAPFGISRVLETNLMEQDIKEAGTKVALHGNEIDLDVAPYSINTVRLLYPAHSKNFWHVQAVSQ